MIRFTHVTRHYPDAPRDRPAVRDVSFELARGEKLGIIGGNGAGKSTVIRLAAGIEKPTLGKVERTMSCSWPLGFGGAFQSSLTGWDNLRFICRIYSVAFGTTSRFVQEFSELGEYLAAPIRTYSSGMRAKYAFALSLAVDFECLLIDEVIAVGDARFREKCHAAIASRSDQALMFVSHDFEMVRQYCSKYAVMHQGEYFPCATIEEAIEFSRAASERDALALGPIIQ